MNATRPRRFRRLAASLATFGAALALPATAGEAPDLAAAVAAGTLPPLQERLPAEPLTVTPLDAVGTYGGTWRSAVRGTGDSTWIRRTIGYDSLVRWDHTFSEIVPNLAASFEVSEDATTYTFQLRDGVKWSDGTPFTSADILFWHADVNLGDEVGDGVPGWMETAEGDCGVEAPDPLTVRIVCPGPNGLILENIASTRGEQLVAFPRHYLAPFHKAHAAEADLAAAVAAEGVADWVELFRKKADFDGAPLFQNAEKPTLYGWKLSQPYTGTQVGFERNPYYWKVDTEGNQLPYIDRVIYDIAQDNEVLLLKALNGELDLHARHFNTIANKALVIENSETSGYGLIDMPTTDVNYVAISLNLAHPDEARRALYGNRDFRIGLSHAIDRDEIIDLVFLGAGEPFQVGPIPGTPYYNERLGTQYTAFDLALAEEHLDRAGLTEKDASGERLGPDGQPVTIRLTVRNDLDEVIDTLELVRGHWAAVGITLDLDVVERSLFRTRTRANEHDAAADNAEAGGDDFFMLPDNWYPSDVASYWGLGWHLWMSGEREGGAVEPPAAALRAQELFLAGAASTDATARTAAVAELTELQADEFWQIGVARPVEGYGIVSSRMRNVPATILDSFSMSAPGPARSEQFYFAE